MKHLDLFSGIGGFALATEMVWEDVEHVFCDNDLFSQAILKKHWPNAPIFSDIKRFNIDVRNAIIAICEEKTGSALCAEYQKRLMDVPIANPATPNESQNGGGITGSLTELTKGNGLGQARKKSSITTEENVLAAERKNESLSPLTTNLTTGMQSGESINHKPGNLHLNEDSQTTTSSYATTATTLKLITEHVLTKQIDILTGGFPCQPFSHAGKRKGNSDDRFLWPYLIETIRLVRPKICLLENVAGLLSIEQGMVFETVCTDLESEGYEVGAFVIPAAAVGAPHRRDRVWITGYAKHHGLNGAENGKGHTARSDSHEEGAHKLRQSQGANSIWEDAADTGHPGLQGSKRKQSEGHSGFSNRSGSFQRSDWHKDWHEVAATSCRVDDGIPRRLDRTPRLKALGNAIVPQVAAEVMRAIRDITK